MRKTIFLFITIIIVTASVNWIDCCAEVKPHKEVFASHLAHAEMYEYKDKDYDYVVRVPSFFNAQPDSLQEEKGRMRFEYGDLWITIVIESHVMRSPLSLDPSKTSDGQLLYAGMDSLARIQKATERKLGSDYFVLSGPQYESGCRIDGYSYYTKVVAHQRLWFVYTMVYPDDYKDVLARLFKEIDDWQLWDLANQYP